MKQKYWQFATILLLAATLVAACGPTATPAPVAPEPTAGGVIRGKAVVEEIDILILESFPVQVNVLARGYLPDGCTEIDEIQRTRTGQTFQVTITTVRPADAACTEAIVPFEEVIPLDVLGLKAGTYTVDVNGVSGRFELSADNEPVGGVPPSEQPDSAPPVLTWHREGGLAGFCDDLTIDATGLVDAASCTGDPSATVSHGQLPPEDLVQLQAWLDQYGPFGLEQVDPATADGMAISLTFAGRSPAQATETEKQQILDFAAQIYTRFTGG